MSVLEARDGIIIGPDAASPTEPRQPLFGYHSWVTPSTVNLPSSFGPGDIHNEVISGVPYVGDAFLLIRSLDTISTSEGVGIIDWQITGEGEVTVRFKNHSTTETFNGAVLSPQLQFLIFGLS